MSKESKSRVTPPDATPAAPSLQTTLIKPTTKHAGGVIPSSSTSNQLLAVPPVTLDLTTSSSKFIRDGLPPKPPLTPALRDKTVKGVAVSETTTLANGVIREKSENELHRDKFTGVAIPQSSSSPRVRIRNMALDVLTTAHGLGKEADTKRGSSRSESAPGSHLGSESGKDDPLLLLPALEPGAGNGELSNLGAIQRHPPKTPRQLPKSSSFFGVVIADKSPPKSRKSSTSNDAPRGQTLLSALSLAFMNNKSKLVVESTAPRPRSPKVKRIPSNRRTVPTSVLESRTRPPPLRPEDIQATLGTQEATIRELRAGGRGMYDPENWKQFTSGAAGEQRRRVCLRFVEAEARNEEQEKGKDREPVYAVPSKSRTEGFIERLEKMFGPGSVHRGTGPKPKPMSGEVCCFI